MIPCPTCKGSGETSLSVAVYPKPPVLHKITCIDCKGAGLVTVSKFRRMENFRRYEAQFWCKCGNPSHNTSYHKDTPKAKHHWTCDDCGKVTQVG